MIKTSDDIELIERIREAIPDIPKNALSVDIHIRFNEPIVIDCSYYPDFPEDDK